MLFKLERNYFVYKLEFFVLKWVVIERFYEYLYGREFEVRIDNNFLIYVLFIVKLDVIGYRWVFVFVEYWFKLFYKFGKNN